MFRIILWLSLVAGLALASGPVTRDDIDVGVDGAEVEQAITVEIPPRYALHLVTTDWVLDLGNLAADVECYLVPKDTEFSFRQFKAYQRLWFRDRLTLSPTRHYPAVILDRYGNVAVKDGEYQKGSLICFFSKVLQKFTNVPDWQLEVDFIATAEGGVDAEGFGNFLLQDYLHNRVILEVGTRGTSLFGATDQDGTTGGWLDNTLVEGFWFDGTEAPGTYNIDIIFTLMADKF